MKKSKFLALVLVVALAVMGSAYAYFTDALNITTTASTAELNVQFSPVGLLGASYQTGAAGYNDYENTIQGQGDSFYGSAESSKGLGQYSTGDYVFDKDNVFANGASTFKVDASGKSLSMEISNLYPGSGAFIRDLLIVNKGTIGAKLESVNISNIKILNKDGTQLNSRSAYADIRKNLEFGVKYNNIYNACSLENMENNKWDPFVHLYNVVLEAPAGATTEQNKLDFDKLTLQYLYVQLNPELKDKDTQNLKISFDLTANWTQHNAGAAAGINYYATPSNVK